MNQNDSEFLQSMIQERMTQLYAAAQNRNKPQDQRFSALEERLNKVLSLLTEEQAKDVHQYMEYFFEQTAGNESFFYRSGLLDGYKLCQCITAWTNSN